jgi:hypothetical protein
MVTFRCSRQRRERLRILGGPRVTWHDYCAARLPLTVGHLSARGQANLLSAGPPRVFQYRHVIDLTRCDQLPSPEDLAGRLLRGRRAATDISADRRLIAPIVADIIAFDRSLFQRATRASLVWARDRPDPSWARDVRWHQDYRFHSRFITPWRFYLVRSHSPTEFIRDHAESDRPYGRFNTCYGLYARGDTALLSPRNPELWLAGMKQSGLLWHGQPFDVVLSSSTWHRSSRPRTAAWSTFLHVGLR